MFNPTHHTATAHAGTCAAHAGVVVGAAASADVRTGDADGCDTGSVAS